MVKKYLFAFFSVAILISGCIERNDTPDISHIKVDLKTYRFDTDLFTIDTNHIGDGLKQLAVKYPDFLNFFLDTMLNYGIHGNYSDTTKGISDGLRIFL